MGFKEKMKDFFNLNEEEAYDEYDTFSETEEEAVSPIAPAEPVGRKPVTNRTPVVPIASKGGQKVAKISVVEPRVYAEVTKIVDIVLANDSVLVNLRRVDEAQSRQIIDFLTGAAYAIKGEFQKISAEIFLCTPASVEVEGIMKEITNEAPSFDLNR